MTSTNAHAGNGSGHAPDGLFAAVPIMLVNALAVVGQTQWAGTHLHWTIPGRLLFAAALETVALSVSYYAHRSLLEGDSAVRLRLGAYSIAAGAATINYQEHGGPHWEPTPAAAVFAAASLLSPILWTMYSRYASRSVMRAAGLIDRRAARFSVARWALFPGRTLRAFRYSVWASVQSPAEAIKVVSPPQWQVPPADSAPAAAASSAPEPVATIPSQPEPVPAPEPEPEPETTVPDTDTDYLVMAEPPGWAGMSQQAAIERADTVLPGRKRSAPDLVRVLATVGVETSPEYVRAARKRIRERQAARTGGGEVIPLSEAK